MQTIWHWVFQGEKEDIDRHVAVGFLGYLSWMAMTDRWQNASLEIYTIPFFFFFWNLHQKGIYPICYTVERKEARVVCVCHTEKGRSKFIEWYFF